MLETLTMVMTLLENYTAMCSRCRVWTINKLIYQCANLKLLEREHSIYCLHYDKMMKLALVLKAT